MWCMQPHNKEDTEKQNTEGKKKSLPVCDPATQPKSHKAQYLFIAGSLFLIITFAIQQHMTDTFYIEIYIKFLLKILCCGMNKV